MTSLPSRAAVAAEALSIALTISQEWWRDRALRALVPLLAAEQLPDAQEAIGALPSPGIRSRALAQLAATLPPQLGAALAEKALTLAESLPDTFDRAQVAVLALPSLTETRQTEVALAALALVTQSANQTDAVRGLTVADLAGFLPAAEREAALAHVRAISSAAMRVEALAITAGKLPDQQQAHLFDEATTTARSIPLLEDRARSLAHLTFFLEPGRAEPVAREALDAAESSGDELTWGRVLLWAGQRLPAVILQSILPRALTLALPEARAQALSALAADLPGPRKAEAVRAALDAVAQVDDEWVRVAALSLLGPHLSANMAADAVTLAEALTDCWARADALSGLARHLPPEAQAAAFQGALTAARACEAPWPRARALTVVAGRLPVDS